MEAKFYRAVSYLDCSQIKDAIKELNEILLFSPQHSQLTHILLSIAYKRDNNMEDALAIVKFDLIRFIFYVFSYQSVLISIQNIQMDF